MSASACLPGVRHAARALLIATWFSLALPAHAQAPAPTPESSGAPTPTEIESAREVLEENTELPQEARSKALEYYERASDALSRLEAVKAETAELAARIEEGPSRVAELRERRSAPPSEVEAVIPAPDVSTEELQTVVNETRAALSVARDTLNEKEARLAAITKSGTEIVREFFERERSLNKVIAEAAAPPPADMPHAVDRARKTYLAARRELDRAELERMRRRNASYDLLVELARLERDAAAAEVARIEDARDRLEEALQARRESDVRAERSEARAAIAAAARLPAPVAAIAQEIASLKADQVTIVEREKTVNEGLRTVAAQYRDLQEKFQSVREQIAIYGASQALGRLLQRRLRNLPSPRELRGLARERRGELVSVTNRRIEVEERQQQLGSIEFQVAAVLSSVTTPMSPRETEQIRDDTIDLATRQRETLEALDRSYGRYLTRLTALNAAEGEVANISEEFSRFIRKKLTWIPNLTPLAPDDFAGLPEAIGWLLSPENWRQAISDAGETFVSHPLLSGAALLAIVLAVTARWQARHRLRELAELTRRVRTDAYRHTVKALVLTLAAAAVWPLVFAIGGWQVEADPIGGRFGNAVGGALMDIVPIVYVVTLLKWLTRGDGLGHAHFRWPEAITRTLYARIGWIGVVLIPAAFLVALASNAGIADVSYALGRSMLLIALLLLAAFVWRLFRRSGAFMRHFDEHRPDGWISRLWFLWFPLLLAVPVGMLVGAALGYSHTAAELTALLVGETALLLLLLLLTKDMLLRWFYVIERNAKFESALRYREEARAARDQPEEDTGTPGFEVDVPEVDYRSLGEQARAVIRGGVLIGIVISISTIWGDLLPAIGVLDQVELPMSKLEIVDGVEQHLPVTLADLLIGVLIIAGTLFAAKNLSGILEFTVLRRLRLDAGGNYAIVTLCQYSIVAIGLIAAFSTMGLQWSKLQWLIAALGVGLGFGLQEIVANFVSGIILLLERPVRIGDIVTVGGADGFISRIRIRATTILTWEKKELIIPNKEFITGQVVNWTLSDSVNRILINVGIAYGSDVRKALELLERIAEENEMVLDDPRPIITFEAFGDNALNLYVRCYIASVDNRLETVTALHEAIYAAFEEAGIVIAFPQRDVHLATSEPLEVRVRQDELRSAGGAPDPR